MPGEIVGSARNEEIAAVAGLVATDLSWQVQTVGSAVMREGGLLEVEPDRFSTCPEPLAEFGDRLVRARDTQTPLVEVTTFPKEQAPLLRELFGIRDDEHLVLRIIGALGLEKIDENSNGALGYEAVGLSIPGHHFRPLDGNSYGSKVSSVLTSGRYSGYELGAVNGWGNPVKPGFGSGDLHEAHNDPSDRKKMTEAIRRIVYYHSLAVRLGGNVGSLPTSSEDIIDR